MEQGSTPGQKYRLLCFAGTFQEELLSPGPEVVGVDCAILTDNGIPGFLRKRVQTIHLGKTGHGNGSPVRLDPMLCDTRMLNESQIAQQR